MSTVLYFSYGSNMLVERIRKRCASAKVYGKAQIENYSINFSKRSIDGSGKATLSTDTGGLVYGVVFELHENELAKLDQAEGAGNGYHRHNSFMVRMDGSQEQLRVATYIADPIYICHSLRPYDWYVRLVVAGAQQHKLPFEYIEEIKRLPSDADPELNRKSRLEALTLLEGLPE